MLAYVAGSVSTDLNVWERRACPCVSQAVCHSAATASVVWPLALDFIFTRCVSPCPWNFNIGCCANEKPLRLIAHRRVRFFTFMFVSTLVLGEGGGTHWIQFKLRKICWFWRLMTVPPQCQHDLEKTVGTFIGRSFFWRRGISFRFGQFVSLSTEAIFSFNFWEAASIVSLGEAKNGFIFEIKFWLRVWSQLLSFWSLWQVIPDWLVLEATGCEQRELSLLCCGSTSMIPAFLFGLDSLWLFRRKPFLVSISGRPLLLFH